MCCHFHILRFICLSSMWVNMTFGTMLSCCRIPPDAVRGSSCHNDHSVSCIRCDIVGTRRSLKNSGSHIDASHSRQPLVKGERLVRYEVNAVMPMLRYPRCYHIWNASRPLCGIAGGCAPLCCTLQDETSGCRIGSRDGSASLICAHPCGRGNDTTSDA